MAMDNLLKRKIHIIITTFLLFCLCLICCACQKEEQSQPTIDEDAKEQLSVLSENLQAILDEALLEEPTTNPVDPTRENYNLGSCYDMTKDIHYLVIYLNDDNSNWDEKDKSAFFNKKLIPSLEYLKGQAEEYDITLNHNQSEYKNTAIKYDGTIEVNAAEKGKQDDILTQISGQMGYSSPTEMDRALQDEYGVNQIAYLIVLNKEGRSYKYAHVIDNSTKYEYCVFFNSSVKLNEDSCGSTIAHEILHLFGAEDYYDPYGKYPERKNLAQKLFPRDIMLTNYASFKDADVGNYTAYSIGWIDELPEECDTPEWWK